MEETKCLSITEFSNLVERINPATYVFDSDNQLWAEESCGKIVARYNKVVCMLNPNRVCFVGDCGTLCLNGVKEIYYEERGIYMKFQIKCYSQSDSTHDILYIIMADSL